MSQQSKIIKELIADEKLLSPIKYNRYDNYLYVFSGDGRKYFVFKNDDDAKEYFTEQYINDVVNDDEMMEQIEFLGYTPTEYIEYIFKERGIQYIVSYNKHHKVFLENGVAYRIE